MSPPRCAYPGCLADATHRVYYWHRKGRWMNEPYQWKHKRYCRWHATCVCVQANARNCTPEAVLRQLARQHKAD